nr:EOG090X0515 [Cyclestheria hislopi]
MTNGLKVYYLPLLTFYNGVTLPTMLASLPLIRQIFIRDKVDIVHGHSAFSTLAHEAMAIGRLMGLKAVFTDHSLFGFADSSAILTNKLLQISLAGCNHCICVSKVGKENTILRAGIDENKVSVIRNAIDTTLFKPDLSKWDQNRKIDNKIIIVVMCRLVYRKGVDLLPEIIRRICEKYKNVHFLIGGEGPKRLILEEVREKHFLHERVVMLGKLNQCEVRDTLVKGDIFLNTSLTEAFCMAIVEAAACGLQVVSTNVGGIREVLSPEMIFLAEPSVDDIFANLEKAIKRHESWSKKDVEKCHSYVMEQYKWDDVAIQTVNEVYNKVRNESPLPIGQLLQRYGKCGKVGGPLFVLLFTLCHLFLMFLDWYIPIELIDIAPPYNL